MDFTEAKAALKDGYVQAGLELSGEQEEELLFLDPASQVTLRLSEQEIRDYAASAEERVILQPQPVECSICNEHYREQAVSFPGRPPMRYFVRRERTFTFGDPTTGATYAQIGPASSLFVDFFRFHDAYLDLCLDRERRRRRYRQEDSDTRAMDMHEVLIQFLTIKVHNIGSSSAKAALERSTSLIDACLFQLSYLKRITLTLQDEWQRPQSRVPPFRFGEPMTGDDLPLPRAYVHPDLARFYQRGMATYDPVNQFLSFYQVLEYHFVSVSNEHLYEKLARRFHDPRFTATPKKLDRIIQDTLDHKRETDETEMLKMVLNKYVDEAELIEFIQDYEGYLDDGLYTKRRKIFPQQIEVKLQTGHTVGNVASRIKLIRNALVHSSDRPEGSERYIPTARNEKIIAQEVPLVRYLAERVIIASATRPRRSP